MILGNIRQNFNLFHLFRLKIHVINTVFIFGLLLDSVNINMLNWIFFNRFHWFSEKQRKKNNINLYSIFVHVKYFANTYIFTVEFELNPIVGTVPVFSLFFEKKNLASKCKLQSEIVLSLISMPKSLFIASIHLKRNSILAIVGDLQMNQIIIISS